MGKLYCILGKSASGKDTVYGRLSGDKDLNLKAVVTYTTRPKRSGETEGREYHFTDEETLMNFRAAGRIIEERVYHTVHGDWYYFTADDGSISVNDGSSYIMVTTPEAFAGLKAAFGEDFVVPIYICIDDGVRLSRALKREQAQDSPRYAEMCRRYLADEEDFAPEKLESVGIEAKDAFFNDDLEKCLSRIKDVILGNGSPED
ncbi:MAG: guanylate kinase [Lachnospiraceae bacterium]|nr:guanylate kinase [Lachnospiraceae bacterium]